MSGSEDGLDRSEMADPKVGFTFTFASKNHKLGDRPQGIFHFLYLRFGEEFNNFQEKMKTNHLKYWNTQAAEARPSGQRSNSSVHVCWHRATRYRHDGDGDGDGDGDKTSKALL